MTYVIKPVEENHGLGIQRLQELVRATCLRRTKQQTLASGLLSLPHRTEKIIPVYLHPDDQVLYNSVKRLLQKTASGSDKPLRKDVSAKTKEKNVMVLLNSLRLICNHGEELVPQLAKRVTANSSASYFDQIQQQIHVAACSSCGGETDGVCAGPRGSLCVACANLETAQPDSQLGVMLEQRGDTSDSQSTTIGKPTFGKNVRRSAKVIALVNSLRQEASISDQKHMPRKRYISVPYP